jgi:hypothetical protein
MSLRFANSCPRVEMGQLVESGMKIFVYSVGSVTQLSDASIVNDDSRR